MSVRRNRRTRGFTLIELAIVNATILILCTVSFAYLTGALNQAHDSESSTTMSSIERMMIDYYNNNYQYPPSGAQNPPEPASAGSQVWVDGQPGWNDIGFLGDGQSYMYRYEFTSTQDSSGLYSTVTIHSFSNLGGLGTAGDHYITLEYGEEVLNQ